MARSRDELTETAAQVKKLGADALVIPADLGAPDQVARITVCIASELGTIGIVINNAAVVAPLGPAVRAGTADWTAAIQINIMAPAVLTLALLPGMIEAGEGRIVNISSGIAARPEAMAGMNAYATSKAALEAHTLNLAAELAGTGVTANIFRPGSVDTVMQAWIRPRTRQRSVPPCTRASPAPTPAAP